MTNMHVKAGIAAAETIARRLPIMWGEMVLPTKGGQAEMALMVAEKQQAFVSGMLAAQLQLAQEAMRFWFNPFALHNPQRAVQRVADASLRPAHRKVRANAKRLGGK